MLQLIHEFLGHQGSIYAVTTQDNFIYTGASDCKVVRWDLQTAQADSFTVQTDSVPISLACDKYLYIGLLNGSFHVVDPKNQTEIHASNLNSGGIFSIHPNLELGHVLLGTEQGKFHVLEANHHQEFLSVPLDCGKIRQIIYDPIQKVYLMAAQNGFIYLIDSVTFEVSHSFLAHDGGVNSLLFGQDGQLISGGKDGHIKTWDLKNSQCTLSFPAHRGTIYGLLQTSVGLISASRDKSIKIWDSKNYKPLQKIGFHKHSVNAIVQQNNHFVVSVSDDKKIGIWKDDAKGF